MKMAESKTNASEPVAAKAPEPVVPESSVETPDVPIAAPANAQIGDENLAPVHKVEVDETRESVDAQVMGEPAEPVTQVPVHEVHVRLDKVITDPSSPEAVQIPDAGRGDLTLPIHSLAAGTPEDVFKSSKS